MSDASDNALHIFNTGNIQRALALAIKSVDENPNDWHCHYAVGICLRHLKYFSRACDAYENSLKLDQNQPSVLLALAIARQLNDQLDQSVVAAKRAIELDPDFYLAFNTLGMTRKLQGEFEFASLNYETGAKILARRIMKTLVNSQESPQLPDGETKFNLWVQYAMDSAVFNGISSGVERVFFSTAEAIESGVLVSKYGGCFWADVKDAEGKVGRLFLPNFFNTMFHRLKQEPTFRNFLGNRYTVLKALGQYEEAEKHLYEFEELSDT
jgi:tetratricopeptide (TPR) repeat protein